MVGDYFSPENALVGYIKHHRVFEARECSRIVLQSPHQIGALRNSPTIDTSNIQIPCHVPSGGNSMSGSAVNQILPIVVIISVKEHTSQVARQVYPAPTDIVFFSLDSTSLGPP